MFLIEIIFIFLPLRDFIMECVEILDEDVQGVKWCLICIIIEEGSFSSRGPFGEGSHETVEIMCFPYYFAC
jgi:hypothetical protein